MDILEIKLTKENLSIIKNIDETFYKDERFTLDWYQERYKDYHDGFLLKDENNCYVGYLVYVPVKKELYDMFVNGKLSDDVEIDSKLIIEKSDYIYIVSIVILEEYRRKGYGTKMLNRLFEISKAKNFCSISVSKDGYNLLKKKLYVTKKVNDKVYAFEKRL